jgi:riboflavin synthase
MFTGLIQAVGTIEGMEPRGGDVRLLVATGGLEMADVRPGDSIAVNGACLTALEPDAERFAADVSRETLALTTLGELKPGAPVNLEKSLTLGTPLGGHLVSGHVDGVGVVLWRRNDGRAVRFGIEAPEDIARYIARKGSIAIDGTSLTVNAVDDRVFEIAIIPHTLERTVTGNYQTGTRVNLEVDMLARYVERLMGAGGDIAGNDTAKS